MSTSELDVGARPALEVALRAAISGQRPDLHERFSPRRTDPEKRGAFFLDCAQVTHLFALGICALNKNQLPYWDRASEHVIDRMQCYQSLSGVWGSTMFHHFPLRFKRDEYFASQDGKPIVLTAWLKPEPSDLPGAAKEILQIPRILCDAAYMNLEERMKDLFVYLLLCVFVDNQLSVDRSWMNLRLEAIHKMGFSVSLDDSL